MELINPKLTIQNTDQAHWVVRMEHDVGDGQRLDITLNLPRGDLSVPALQDQLLRKTARLIEAMLGTPTGG